MICKGGFGRDAAAKKKCRASSPQSGTCMTIFPFVGKDAALVDYLDYH
jgi:hypothetical protein